MALYFGLSSELPKKGPEEVFYSGESNPFPEEVYESIRDVKAHILATDMCGRAIELPDEVRFYT